MKPADYPYALRIDSHDERAPIWRALLGRLVAPIIAPQPLAVTFVDPTDPLAEPTIEPAYFLDWDRISEDARERIVAYRSGLTDVSIEDARRAMLDFYPFVMPLKAAGATLIVRDATRMEMLSSVAVEFMRDHARGQLN